MSVKRDLATPSCEVPYQFYVMTFEEIGAELGLSKQRVEQIYYRALQKIRATGLLVDFADMVTLSRQ